jgi:purine nucleosidase
MKLPLTLLLLVVFLVTGWFSYSVQADAAEPLKVIIDTDIGSDIDDAFALGLAIASPELELIGITTVGGGNEYDPYVGQRKDRDDHRAWLVTRFLTQARFTPPPPTDAAAERAASAFNKAILKDGKDIPVAAGADPQPQAAIDGQIQYRRHPAAIYNRTLKPVKESAVELMTRLLQEHDGVTIIAIGPLTNVARLIDGQPDLAKKIKRLVVMGGSIAVGYDGKPQPEVEWNIKLDIRAAQKVLSSSIPLLLVPLDATSTVALEAKQRNELFAAHTPLTWQLQNLYELWNKETPILFDPVAVAAAFAPEALQFQELQVRVLDDGLTVVRDGGKKMQVATKIDREKFLTWFIARIKGYGQESLPSPPQNLSKLIPPGNFPARVHAFEDYETDIEKRWIMCGKLAEGLADAPSKRVCRSVLTQDFDDRQGQTKTMYRAVIFNPVPGPPMRPKTQLKFHYKLTGTDTLRVQLYSLTNGYHRYLMLTGLEQNKWLEGCVDMTQMRRPDGSGGPLAANERIDDIQFYVDPRAEVLIDNIVLYDAAPATEQRPFPQRILFTGWFDTGKQGKEWPGRFDVVEHTKPREWKFAQSVKNEDGRSVLSVSLRGERPVNGEFHLTMLLRFSAARKINIQLVRKGKVLETREAHLAAKDSDEDWRRLSWSFDLPQGSSIDEVRLESADGQTFGIDDLLLYEP